DSLDDLAEILLRPRVIAVGETGMDLYRKRIPEKLQIEIFKEHIRLAETFGLTLIVHSRSAEREVLDVLGDDVTVPVIMHCYTGPDDTAREAADRGYYIGFAGVLTFRKNERLRNLAGSLPADRILIETDAPYMSPEPVRGRRNEPSNVKYVADTISEIWGRDPEETAGTLLKNSLKAMQLGPTRRTDLVYSLYGNIYMNITGRCTNHCRFCIKDRTDGIGGYYLKHHGEPLEERLDSIIDSLSPHMGKELVFCGYGEPTMRPDVLNRLAGNASNRGFSVRLNTNGTCLSWLSPEETAELLEPFDAVNVSLNASCREEYNSICRPADENTWDRLMEFIELAGRAASVRLTAVRYPGVSMESVEKLAKSLSLPFRIRG
ncbi:MAG: TatD family nuclease-associated radical SAM protein, partial [Candidatus Aegiribacteria sp.]|nr:TatD family nuclease-associated radical SAM protein [Candidatus Aegiribacteria sp.]